MSPWGRGREGKGGCQPGIMRCHRRQHALEPVQLMNKQKQISMEFLVQNRPRCSPSRVLDRIHSGFPAFPPDRVQCCHRLLQYVESSPGPHLFGKAAGRENCAALESGSPPCASRSTCCHDCSPTVPGLKT